MQLLVEIQLYKKTCFFWYWNGFLHPFKLLGHARYKRARETGSRLV